MSDLTLGCEQLPRNMALNEWFVDFVPYRDKRIAYWHVTNETEDMPKWEQIAVLYEVFNELNFYLAKYGCHLISTSEYEKAFHGGIVVTFAKNGDKVLPMQFPRKVMAYALNGMIFVNDELFWSSREGDNKSDLTYTLIHEALHSLGLEHTKAPHDIMNPVYNPANYITSDSANGLAAKYGNEEVMTLTTAATSNDSPRRLIQSKSPVFLFMIEAMVFIIVIALTVFAILKWGI